MYKEHFGLKEIPFSIAPDPRYLYMSEGHQEALAHLVYGIKGDGGFVLLTGEVGAGKTTVCRCLLEQVPANTDVAFVLNPKMTSAELLAVVCDELGVNYPEDNKSIKVFVDCINAYLLDSHARGRNTVLIIEEAQNLSSDVLEQLRLLTNLETNQRKLLQIIMLGQPELQAKLARPELRQLAQRVTARYHLGSLAKSEIGAYIAHRLAIAGVHSQLFLPSTFGKLFRLSGGVPRLINVICDRALLGAYVQGKERVDGTVIAKAAREVFGEAAAPESRRKVHRWAAAAAVSALCIAVLAVFYFGRTGHDAGAGGARQGAALSGEGRSRLDTLWWFGDYSRLWKPLPEYESGGGQALNLDISPEGTKRELSRSATNVKIQDLTLPRKSNRIETASGGDMIKLIDEQEDR